jgi:hypothetical protein
VNEDDPSRNTKTADLIKACSEAQPLPVMALPKWGKCRDVAMSLDQAIPENGTYNTF